MYIMAKRPGRRDEFGLSAEDREAGLFTLGDVDDLESRLMALNTFDYNEGPTQEPSGPPDDDMTKRFEALMKDSPGKGSHKSIEERVAILETKVKKLEGNKKAQSKKKKISKKAKKAKKAKREKKAKRAQTKKRPRIKFI